MRALRARWRRLDRDDRVAAVTVGLAVGVVNALMVTVAAFTGPEPLIAIGVIDASLIAVAGLAVIAEKMVK